MFRLGEVSAGPERPIRATIECWHGGSVLTTCGSHFSVYVPFRFPCPCPYPARVIRATRLFFLLFALPLVPAFSGASPEWKKILEEKDPGRRLDAGRNGPPPDHDPARFMNLILHPRFRFPAACAFLALSAALSAASAPDSVTVLFFGDSLTAGYGLDDPKQAYPYRVAEYADADELPLRVIPSGLSGETTAGGLRRIGWVMRPPRDWPRNKPFQLDILVLALGGNDGLRGIEIADTRRNLQGIIDRARAKYPDLALVLAGIEMPVNWGEVYRRSMRALFRDLARANDAAFIPSLLQGVGANPDLMQADRIHPNAEGHRKMARLVWETLKPVAARVHRSP